MAKENVKKEHIKTNILPNNLEAEQALLGCLLIDNDTQTDILDKLTEEDFYQESHKLIIGAMKRVFNARKPVDMVTLSDELENLQSLESAGGLTYITDLAKITPSAANYRYYLEIVKRDSVNRKLIRAAQNIIERSMSGVEAAESVSYAEELVFDVSKKMDTSTLVDMREDDSYDKVLSKFETITTDKNALRGVFTGFTKLDKITNGLQKSDFIVLAARPGVGKTTIGMNIIEHAALVENKVWKNRVGIGKHTSRPRRKGGVEVNNYDAQAGYRSDGIIVKNSIFSLFHCLILHPNYPTNFLPPKKW